MSHLSCQNPGQVKHVKSKLREAFNPLAASGISQHKVRVMRHRGIEKREEGYKTQWESKTGNEIKNGWNWLNG